MNYGTVTFSGTTNFTAMGGVMGSFLYNEINTKHSCFIENCANYGRLVHSGKTDNMLVIGGIIGVLPRGKIDNCINYDLIKVNQDALATGKIIGVADKKLAINNCFWTNKQDTDVSWGFEYMSTPVATNTHLVKSNVTTMDILNEWVRTKSGGEYNHSKWMMLHLNGGSMGTVNEDDILIVPQKPFPEPAKEGHTFSCWCTDPECASSEYSKTFEDVTDLYAEWEPNNYTVTFDYGNGTLIYSSFTFSTTIVYPVAPRRKGFYGWNSSIERMPGHNLVIGPDTTPPPSKSHAGAIAGGVIGGVALIAIIVIIVLFFVMRRTRNRGEDQYELAGDFRFGESKGRRKRKVESMARTRRMTRRRRKMRMLESREGGRGVREVGRSAAEEDRDTSRTASDKYVEEEKEECLATSGTSTAFPDTLYPRSYGIPTMIEALKEAGLREKGKVKQIVEACEKAGMNAVRGGNVPEGFTVADAAAVAMYTFDFGDDDGEYNPYELIDDALAFEGRAESVRGILFVLMRALRKLPRCEDRLLYRSLRGAIDGDMYKKGSIVTWPAIVSTSPDMGVAKRLIEEAYEIDGEENAGDVKGTLFVIENAWGYNIQPYSLFPDDDGEEILLEPERRFQVDSVITSSDLMVVNLKMLDTPVVLPQVFGGNTTK